jgi:(E)-4-hydroxy-3-methylbut-2-enyl-diphosphate synthase
MTPPFRVSTARRPTREVRIGATAVGAANPVRVQSMLTSDTMDTTACVREALELAEAGCEIIRITAPTVKDARNLEAIRDALQAAGCGVPLVADIHFKPEAAMEAARWVDKVRINPGNFADSKKFTVREYTDLEYAAALERIHARFTPLVELCKARGIAMRIGTNHGSLSDRVMNRFGDTPLGMVESALEFARIARDSGYHALVFSMKASNPKVMIQAYRLLVARLEELTNADPHGESWNYPIHLGVTEAGDGEDGRIKSAIGIGSLLADGIGDTIRVSLTEDAVREIPVARDLVRIFETHKLAFSDFPSDPFVYRRRASEPVFVNGRAVGGLHPVRIALPVGTALPDPVPGREESQPDVLLDAACEVVPGDQSMLDRLNASPEPRLVTLPDGVSGLAEFRWLAAHVEERHPILLKETADTRGNRILSTAAMVGALLCDGIGDAFLLRGEASGSLRLGFNILQAAGVRIFKTDYVACPSCGRTLFNLQDTTARIKAATNHLKGVKIAIMGCIVNGPGEMADADFGYVGGAPGKINLYVGKTPVKFNIPQAEAVDRLVDLIQEHGRWIDP